MVLVIVISIHWPGACWKNSFLKCLMKLCQSFGFVQTSQRRLTHLTGDTNVQSIKPVNGKVSCPLLVIPPTLCYPFFCPLTNQCNTGSNVVVLCCVSLTIRRETIKQLESHIWVFKKNIWMCLLPLKTLYLHIFVLVRKNLKAECRC